MATLLKAKGLATLPNFLSEIPEGALLEALNVVIDRDGVIEPRRGFTQWRAFGSANDRAKQIMRYREKILVHYANKLAFESSTALEDFTDFTGASPAVVQETETGRRIRGVEAGNGNFYFTTNTGIKKISASTDEFTAANGENRVLPSGVVQALDPIGTVNYTTSGFMLGLSKVAYRIVIGLTDNNSNLILGAPSNRVIVTNLSSQTCNVDLRILLPAGLTTDNFIQVYRSNNPFASDITLLADTTSPNDEMQQVAEYQLTAADLALGYVNLTETTPAEIQEVGAFLYTNQFSGEGLAQTNNIPPFAKDIVEFKGSVFFANTRTAHTKDLNLLSVSGLESLDILAASQLSTQVTLTTSAPHGLLPGNSAFITLPNSEALYTVVSVAPLANTLEVPADTFQDMDEVRLSSSGTLPSPLVNNKFYRIRYLSPTSVSLLDDNGSVIDLTTAGTGTISIYRQKAINAVYQAETGSIGSTLIITVNSAISLLSLPESGAKVMPAALVIAKLDATTTNSYYFGGGVGEFSVSVVDSVITSPTTIEDRYLLVNAFDRERRYYFYLSLNDAAPALNTGSFPDTEDRIPVNVVLKDRTLACTHSGNIITSVAHGLVSGDRIINSSLGSLTAGAQYFVIRLSDDTFQVAHSYNGTPHIIGGAAGDVFIRSSSVDISKALADKLLAYGDWNSPTKYELDFDPSQVNTITDRITIPNHGLLDGDRAIIASSITGPAVNALDEIMGDGYYVKVIDSSTIELYVDAGLTNIVDFTGQGLGVLTLLTNRLKVVNATVGQFGYSSAITPINADVQDGAFDAAPTFSVTIDKPGFGESSNLTTKDFLVRRSQYALVANQIDETARSLIKLININADESVFAFYTSGSQDFTPRITFTAKNLQDTAIVFGLNDNIGESGADDFEPTLSLSVTASRTSGTIVSPAVFTSPAHGLVTGDFVVISDEADPLFGSRQVTRIDANSFSVATPFSVTARTGSKYYKAEVTTLASVNPNRLYFSKNQQPEAVPVLNYIDIGPKNKAIERIVPLRDSLIVLKEDGIYRITGEVAPQFASVLFDNSNLILAPDSAEVLNNTVYMISTQGVSSVTENGATVISRLIENKLIPLTLYPNFKFATFGFAYESDRSYMLNVPTQPTDTFATQTFRYNLFTQAWTRWDKPLVAATVKVKENKAYVAAPDINQIEIERKSFTRLDHSDRQFNISFSDNFYSVADSTIIIGSTLGYEVGDVLVQTQYVTLGDIKNLALKLSLDPLMPTLARPFYANFTPLAGQSLVSIMGALVDQLNLDLSTTFTAPTTTVFNTFQTEYNAFIDELNASPALQFLNYNYSVGTKPFETAIVSINALLGQFTVDDAMPFVVGEAVHEKSIKTDVIYAPISLGDPSIMKQVRETTTLFENTVFKTASMGYATDLDASFEFINFTMQGSGAYGLQNYGEQVFGGSGPSYPFRTYLPREKQRARYWKIRFKHGTARFRYAMLGISVIPSSSSERAYRG